MMRRRYEGCADNACGDLNSPGEASAAEVSCQIVHRPPSFADLKDGSMYTDGEITKTLSEALGSVQRLILRHPVKVKLLCDCVAS